MSWQKRSIQLVLGFPLALPIISHAVNVGETYIQSGQNEPLNASINVSDIDPKTFSVKVATPEMYKQLGLSDEQTVSAKFEPTSSNGGKIVLTTEQPVATPYADVVLNIENKGEKNLLPKTLLMPINGSQQVVTQPQTDDGVIKRPKIKKTIAKHANVELPQTTVADTNSTNVPLVISKEAPPDLAMTSATPAPIVTANPTPVAPPTVAPTIPNTSPAPVVTTPPLTPITVSEPIAVVTPAPSPDISKSAIAKPDTLKSDTLTSTSVTTNAPATNNKFDTYPEPAPESASATKPTPITKPSKPVAKTTAKPIATAPSEDDTTTYVIQRNDSLWTIASAIATKNHKNVHQVMQDIIDENPDSFENGDPARMLANTELDIPTYSSVPSQASIKASKGNKTRSVVARSPHSPAPKPQPTKAPKKTNSKYAPAKAKHTTTKTTVQPQRPQKSAPKPQLNIISASQSNGSAQGQHPSDSPVSKGSNPQLIEEVKQRRTATASQATRVNQLNGALSSSEQRLKIQNEKLAMLEKRLKELNSQ